MPCGVPAKNQVSKAVNKCMQLVTLWSHVFSTLEFVHRMNVYHLDLSPCNIIFVPKGSDGSHSYSGRFVVIDWGCAACEGEQVKGFRGSLSFAHADIHAMKNTQNWRSHPSMI